MEGFLGGEPLFGYQALNQITPCCGCGLAQRGGCTQFGGFGFPCRAETVWTGPGLTNPLKVDLLRGPAGGNTSLGNKIRKKERHFDRYVEPDGRHRMPFPTAGWLLGPLPAELTAQKGRWTLRKAPFRSKGCSGHTSSGTLVRRISRLLEPDLLTCEMGLSSPALLLEAPVRWHACQLVLVLGKVGVYCENTIEQ